MARDKVIAGDYEGYDVKMGKKHLTLKKGRIFKDEIKICRDTASHEVVTEERAKGVLSGVTRGAAGTVLLGAVGLAPIGLIAGVLSAKNKGTHVVAIKFNDGKNSLIEIDEKLYKRLIEVMF